LSTRLAKSRVDLLEEITPDVERLFNRHMEAPRLWFPHEQINWVRERVFSNALVAGGLSARRWVCQFDFRQPLDRGQPAVLHRLNSRTTRPRATPFESGPVNGRWKRIVTPWSCVTGSTSVDASIPRPSRRADASRCRKVRFPPGHLRRADRLRVISRTSHADRHRNTERNSPRTTRSVETSWR